MSRAIGLLCAQQKHVSDRRQRTVGIAGAPRQMGDGPRDGTAFATSNV
jgi:hypothetical protein